MLTEQVFVGSVFIAGLLSFFSPCIFPLLPVYVAHLGGATPGSELKAIQLGKIRIHPSLIGNTLFFILGLSFVFVLLGFGAGALGSIINNSWFIVICGVVVVLLGIFQTGVVKLLFMQREKKMTIEWEGKKGFVASFLLGFTFSFGWTPCIGPILAAVLSLSASEGSSVQGGGFMLIYASGLAIPFLLLSLFSDLLIGRLRAFNRHMPMLKVISGILLVVMGVLLMTNNLNMITPAF
ncbi:cytochrome c biogenesis CcdA family protein [Paenibacillus radicis (ex Xue et al. 2023)]|uniref:Cytochrome c biogenesis protein CcdA n=1 Tax=Paenibacillus radicis (ex Xue et al. 2023) TaxID=2972489 RepID=A0ABT1YG19_9BACL|nr:cytochrome c biogenesis protein CcdA [Paenibacillus radicis (ex Xue et al. 2023)]MCR8632121.1 cytochrome c biogenesis protein CcdA [Paenibacillus radicis (ex Xue et al. 2023)]